MFLVAVIFVRDVWGGSGGGALSGKVWGYDMYDEPMPLAWARVSVYKNGALVESVSTGGDGGYTMFLSVAGFLNVTVDHPGFKTQSRIVAISEGGSAYTNFYLERSETPIPEFEAYLLPIITAALLILTKVTTKREKERRTNGKD